MNESTRKDAEVIADLVKKHIAPTVVEIQDGGVKGSVLVLPDGNGLRVHEVKPLLNPFRERPERRQGVALLQDLASLIAHVNRFKDPDSAIFANRDMAKPSITAVLDYHEACNREPADGGETKRAQPRFGGHRATYAFPLSDEWNAWISAGKDWMDQQTFAEFLEDRIGDVINPPDLAHAPLSSDDETSFKKAKELLALLGGSFASPNRLIELSSGLALRVGETVKQALNLSTGEVQVQYVSAHQDEQGQPLRVPNLFLIVIPVFKAGALYQIAVRLRYRLRNGSIVWRCEMYRPEKTFEHAFDEACAAARGQTGLPLFIGHPEVVGTIPNAGHQALGNCAGSVGPMRGRTQDQD